MIAQANAKIDAKRQAHRRARLVPHQNEFMLSTPDKVQYMDVVAGADRVGGGVADPVPRARRREPRVDGLEHAAPGGADCLRAEKPLVGTGMERAVAVDSGVTVMARRGGKVDYVDASRIVVRVNDAETTAGEVGRRHLQPDQVHAVEPEHLHQPASAGEGRRRDRARATCIADGPSTDMGELALGQNMLVAFMPWNGYNFEDSILISRARRRRGPLHDDPHRGAVTCVARDTKLGPEEITRDIPNVGEAALGEARRGRHRLHRRRSQGGRHPGGQGHAEGRDAADAGREAAARDLRREGVRREGHVAARAAGHGRHGDRRAGVHARRRREGQARARRSIDERARRVRKDLDDQQRILENDAVRARSSKCCSARSPTAARSKLAKGAQDDEGVPRRRRRATTGSTSAWRTRSRRGSSSERRSACARSARSSTRCFEEKKQKLTQGDDLAARRAEDGEGLPRREAPRAAGRQDGRPPRQQGRDLDDRAGRGHAVHGGRHAGRHRAESARRAVAHEHRPDPRDAPRLGREGPRGSRSARCSTSGSQGRRGARVPRQDLQRDAAARTRTSRRSTTTRSSRSRGNLRDGVPMATPVFDGATEEEIKYMLRARGPARERPDDAVRRSHGRAFRPRRSRSATCTC